MAVTCLVWLNPALQHERSIEPGKQSTCMSRVGADDFIAPSAFGNVPIARCQPSWAAVGRECIGNQNQCVPYPKQLQHESNSHADALWKLMEGWLEALDSCPHLFAFALD
jgi:hypothetical protein